MKLGRIAHLTQRFNGPNGTASPGVLSGFPISRHPTKEKGAAPADRAPVSGQRCQPAYAAFAIPRST